MITKPYNVNADKESWTKIRDMLGGRKINDRKRTVLIRNILEEIDIKTKLNSEITDSPKDKMMKRMLRGFI